MTATLDSLELKLRPPGAAGWSVVDGDQLDPDAAMVVGDFSVSWGRPNPLGQPEPGEISFTIIVPPGSMDERLIVYDTELELTLSMTWEGETGGRQVRAAFGWITSWARDTRPDGRHIYQVEAMDVLGRATASRVADEEWPMESSAARFPKIAAGTSSGIRVQTPGNTWFVGPRKVNAAVALHVLQESVRPGGSVVQEGVGGVVDIVPRQQNRLLQKSEGIVVLVRHATQNIPARMIQDTGRRMDRSTTITELAIGGFPGSYDGSSYSTERELVTHYAAGRAFSASRMVIDGDAILNREAATADWAQEVMAASATPSVILEPGEILTGLGIPVGFGLRGIMEMTTRHQQMIIITGDLLPGVDRVQYLCRGRITIRGRALTLAVAMLPARLFGVRPLRFSDLSPTIRPRMGTYSGMHTRISETSVVTAQAPYTF